MTDTGQVPGEGQPEHAGGQAGQPATASPAGPAAAEQPGAAQADAYGPPEPSGVVVDDDDLLLMPAAQGAWTEQPDRRPRPATPQPQPAPRRPLHMGPPVPDATGGVVRSLADRGPATPPQPPMPVRQPGPPTVGPEYLDVPAADVPTTDVPVTDVPTGDVPATDVPTGDVPAADVPTADVSVTDVPTADVPATEVPQGPGVETGAQVSGPGAQAPGVGPDGQAPVAEGGPQLPGQAVPAAPVAYAAADATLPGPQLGAIPPQVVPWGEASAQAAAAPVADPQQAARPAAVPLPAQGAPTPDAAAAEPVPDAVPAEAPAEPSGQTVDALVEAEGSAPQDAAPAEAVAVQDTPAPEATADAPQAADASDPAAAAQPEADVAAPDAAPQPVEAPVADGEAADTAAPQADAAEAPVPGAEVVDGTAPVAVAEPTGQPAAPEAADAAPEAVADAPAEAPAAGAGDAALEGAVAQPAEAVAEQPVAEQAEAVPSEPQPEAEQALVAEGPEAVEGAVPAAEADVRAAAQAPAPEADAQAPTEAPEAAGPEPEAQAEAPVPAPETVTDAQPQAPEAEAEVPEAQATEAPAPEAQAPQTQAPEAQAPEAQAAEPTAPEPTATEPEAQPQAPEAAAADPARPAPGADPAAAEPAPEPAAEAPAPQPSDVPGAGTQPEAAAPQDTAQNHPAPEHTVQDQPAQEPAAQDPSVPADGVAPAAAPQPHVPETEEAQPTGPAADAVPQAAPAVAPGVPVPAPLPATATPAAGTPIAGWPQTVPPAAPAAASQPQDAAPGAPEAPEDAPRAEAHPEAAPAPEQPQPAEVTGATAPAEAQEQPEVPDAPAAEQAGQVEATPAAPGYDESERAAVHRVMRERRDIRNGFRSDPIPNEVLLRVLEAAHTAPSVGHSQPWDFVVIRSGETRERMHQLATEQRKAYAASLPKGRAKQFRELKIEAILDTPVNIVVTADPTRGGRHTLGRHTQPQMAPYSSALAVENLWLAARAEGLGVGWVSFFDERQMVTELGLPEHLEVVAYLCIGYVDEFPEEPELMQAGWAERRPLSWVVHEETYGRRALPGEDPHDLLRETLHGIRPLDAKALGDAWERQKRMTKPAGALGMLEILSAQLCGLSRKCPPPIPEPAAVAIFAADHGVHAQGVTPWPQEVTGQMVANFLGGGAVCNAFATQVGAEVCVVDVGVATELPAAPGLLPRKVRAGTDDFTAGPAMSQEDVLKAIEAGIETARDLVAAGNKALLTGEMGIANTTASAALISVYTGADPDGITGRGTGINDETHARKVDVVRRALELHRPDPADPIGVLAAVGGLEHAALVGLILGGASLRTPVILDGVSVGAAALVAHAIAPEALAACIAGHRSAEPGHVAALTKLGLRPLVDLDLRLGEGTGALLALPLVQSAARAMHEVATFDTAGVTEKS
ncbi:nicotinate-nucleotide--dimethylbenzimidazole phosphoribosyltransferase [Streptomyces catenulae]|uniref:Nicotinate-nucleotide--dimethylbenzimidazole phosphoribosyltransferase n=1 Tax=Streptomyces catenulae TaxID=66875 RepID=A0ABV2YZW0_9ACTN|nr:nicotinate-nucleotide--dimethylbenzimidazole phosphoribosyltransferase [Streptomyces catenulae]